MTMNIRGGGAGGGKGASAPPTLRLGGALPNRKSDVYYMRTREHSHTQRAGPRRLANSRLRTADLSNDYQYFWGRKTLTCPPIFIVSQPPLNMHGHASLYRTAHIIHYQHTSQETVRVKMHCLFLGGAVNCSQYIET